MNSNPKYLTIFRQGSSHIVDMLEQNTLAPKGEIIVEIGFIEEICRDIRRITMLANRAIYDHTFNKNEVVLSELKKIGYILFSQLLPDRVRENLKNSDATDLFLKLDEHLIYIPWEVCFDGKDFLTTKFKIGRQIRTTHNFKTKERFLNHDKKLKMLIIVDPSETLQYAQREAEALCSILDASKEIDVELIGGSQANRMNLISEMDGKDIIHFIGHSFFDEKNPDKSGWILKNGILTSSEISRIKSPPFIVFSNSCQATASKNHLSGYVYDEQSFGVGGGFLLSGVQNFIGPFWVIHDQDSVRFSSIFYNAFVSGASIGEALNISKETIINEKGWDNLLWASYFLYGDPTLRIKTQKMTDKSDTAQKTASYYTNFSSINIPNHLSGHVLRHEEKSGFLNPLLISISVIMVLIIGSMIFYPNAINLIPDFISNKYSDKFSPVSGPWGYKNGRYTLIDGYWEGNALSYIGKSYTKFKLEMDIYNGEKAWPDAAFGIIINSAISGNALILHFNNDGVTWVKESNGIRSNIGNRISSGNFNKGRLIILGSEGFYQAYLNGMKLTEISTDLFRNGNVGVIIESRWKTPPGFDNISIKNIEGK